MILFLYGGICEAAGDTRRNLRGKLDGRKDQEALREDAKGDRVTDLCPEESTPEPYRGQAPC